MFGIGTSYKSLIDKTARNALNFNPMEAPGLYHQREDIGGYTYNSLEGIAAILFLSQRSLSFLSNPEHFEKSRDRLAKAFFFALEQEYSKAEMHSLVLPLLERRHLEYEAILDREGGAGDHISELGRVLLQNLVGEEIEKTQANLATLFIFEKLMLEPARQLKVMDDAGKIRW